MEINFWLVSLPALISLSLKGGIYLYAHFSRTHSLLTRLYLFTLFAFSIQNIAEVAHFYTLIERGVMPNFEVNVFYAATIIAYAFLFHLSLALAFDPRDKTIRKLAAAIYLYAVILEALLFLTPWLIVGYTPIRQYTVTRIPGPLYWAFEMYTVGICLATIGMLAYGLKRQLSSYKRSQIKIVLMAIIPINLVLVTVLLALHTGVRLFNASVTMPIALTFFLVLTAYAIHQYRLFDIEFFMPWSKMRKRKTAFYARIQATIAEIADLRSVQEVLDLIASTLRCQVALIGGIRPMVALVQGQKIAASHRLADFPREALLQVDHIVVANEVADSRPELHALLKEYQVGAIVPFASHGSTAGNWMLLGEHFSDNVYTPLDFKVVESLFARIADLFVDGLLLVRSQLAEAKEELEKYRDRLALAWHQSAELEAERRKLQEEAARLREENSGLRRERFKVVAGGVADGLPSDVAAGKITLHAYLDQCEAQMLCAALKLAKGNKNEAARLLGFKDHRGLHYLLERHNIDPKESA
jgi:hypothetical protein